MISVCMATYNGQNYLKEQIDSILCQLGRDDELVISDDHSTDKTQEIIKAYTDSRIRFFENELAKGVTHNFENALNKSAGDIIFLSDQDDVWYPNKIKEMTAFLLEGQYEVVTCNCALTDSELHITQETYYTTESPLDKSVWGNFKKDLWLGSCMAFKRTILQDVLPIPKHLAAHDMWIACIVSCISVVDIILMCFNYIVVTIIPFRLQDKKTQIACGISWAIVHIGPGSCFVEV